MGYTKQEIWCKRDDNNIYGKAYVPEDGGRFSLLVFSYELGNNHTTGIEYKNHIILLLIQWIASRMSMGSGAAFMITEPSTKITNLGALKIVLGLKRFYNSKIQ